MDGAHRTPASISDRRKYDMPTTTSKDLNLRFACPLRDAESTSEEYAADLSRAMRSEISTEETARVFFESTHKTDAMGLVCDSVFDPAGKW